MADSNITKKALASALKELMKELPFEKINVSDICEKCDMNRKSFYYHFRDKYDLVNWIFDTEFISLAMNSSADMSYEESFIFIVSVCGYFYQNREFYRRALKISGQNSFPEHFREFIQPLLRSRAVYLMNKNVDEFTIDFLTDAILCAMERWLFDGECLPPEEFVEKLRILIESFASIIHREMEGRKQE